MRQYFPKPYEPFRGDINVKIDLSNYATKSDLKNALGIDTSTLAAKYDLVSLKAQVDKLDIDKLKSVATNLNNLKNKADKLDIGKLKTTPVVLSKLSSVVKNEVVKKTAYNAKIKNIEDKIPNFSNLATKTILNTKINKIKNEIPSISGLATTSALTAVENKIPNVSNLVKKADYDAKVDEIGKKIANHNHNKYITTPENFTARLTRADLVTKTYFDNKLSNLN